uniref:Uncharacterized protein n=1 Tax=Arundo donax TaxID=35708 RepID=A0A0A9HCF5_ARUDO
MQFPTSPAKSDHHCSSPEPPQKRFLAIPPQSPTGEPPQPTISGTPN